MGLQIPSSLSGAGGIAIADNFESLVTWSPRSIWNATRNPNANDDSTNSATTNFAAGSSWLNISTGQVFLCQSAAIGAAVWIQALLIQLDSGGNARGAQAVDLQSARNASTQVASGTHSFIAGGRSNTASGANSFVGAGFPCSRGASRSGSYAERMGLEDANLLSRGNFLQCIQVRL
jgi:hypothetical protein